MVIFNKMNPEDDCKVLGVLKLHAHKLSGVTDTARGVFLLHADADHNIALDAHFVKYDLEECKQALDVSKRSVQFMMDQLVRHDPSQQFLAGVKFPNGDILCHEFLRKVPGSKHRRFA